MVHPTEVTLTRGETTAAIKDEVFREVESVADFNSGEKVASVFDDMLDRSVPFYQEIQRMIAEMGADFATQDTHIYDGLLESYNFCGVIAVK